MDDLIEGYVGEGVEIDDDGEVWEPKCDWYRPAADILFTKDGEATWNAKVADVDWEKTLNEQENVPEGQCELECIVEDEDGWTGLDDIWEDTFAEYIKPYVAKLLEEDADAMVYAVNFHN